ncbi:MAG: signal peptidase I [Gaiellaceae bacterium]
MRPRSTALRALAGVLGVALIAGAWLLFGPKQLGGPVTYALIQGNSMEPMLHASDLAVVRSKSSYEVGDVVAYHSAELDRLVLHRIVERDGDQFILQGDNNDFLDSAQPTQEQIAGELAFSVPKAGALVQRLRSPAGFIVLLGLAGIVVGGGRRARRGRAGPNARAPGDLRGGFPPVKSSLLDAGRSLRPDQLQTAIGIAGGAAAVLALVTILAFARADVETVSTPDLYEQTGTFSYSAEVGESPAYDSTTATDGQAIFTSLANNVDVAFDYELATTRSHAVRGTASLRALVSDGEGLERSLTVSAPQEFSGDTVTLAGTLTLAKLQRLVKRIEKATGVVSNGYFLTLAPQIEVTGRVGEAPIDDLFAPELVFRLDAARLALAQTSALDDSANALVRTQTGSGPETVPATFGLLGLEPSVDSVRRIGLLGTLLALAAFAAAIRMSRKQSLGDLALIAARQGQWLVRATNGVPSDRRCIELAEMEDLLRVAELRGQLVLEVDEADRTTYVVDDGTVQYQYSTVRVDADKTNDTDRDEQGGVPEQRGSFAKDELGKWFPLAERLIGRGKAPATTEPDADSPQSADATSTEPQATEPKGDA